MVKLTLRLYEYVMEQLVFRHRGLVNERLPAA